MSLTITIQSDSLVLTLAEPILFSNQCQPLIEASISRMTVVNAQTGLL